MSVALILSTLCQPTSAKPPEVDRALLDRVVIVLRSVDMGVSSKQSLDGITLAKPFAGDIWQIIVDDMGDSWGYVQYGKLRPEVGSDELFWRRARENTLRQTVAFRLAHDPESGVQQVEMENGLAPSILLQPDACDRLGIRGSSSKQVWVAATASLFIGEFADKKKTGAIRETILAPILERKHVSAMMLSCKEPGWKATPLP